MKTPPAPPYLLPSAELIVAEPWTDPDGAPTPDRLDHWDPFTTVALTRVLTLDIDAIRHTCRLGDDSAFAVTASAYSNRTRLRTAAAAVETGALGGTIRVPVGLDIPGSRAGGRVDVTTRLILRTPGEHATPISPSRSGAVLWNDEVRVAVEGGAARFPVTALPFDTVSRLPDAAAWALDMDSDDLEAPVLGGLRLLVNSGNGTLVASLRTGASDASAMLMQTFVRYDVARAMVHAALSSERFIETPDGFADGSLGRALHDLIVACWPGLPVHTLVARRRDDPSRLDAEIQQHVGVLP